ncbi:MAG: hypothetical protein WD048_14000 [Chitinophagales bacterium]
MKNPISKIILPIVLLIAFSLPSEAQTQYEFAVVSYYPKERELEVSVNGEVYKEITVDKNKVEGYSDVNPAILEIQKMNEKGWEIFEANTNVLTNYFHHKIFTFFLRREKE